MNNFFCTIGRDLADKIQPAINPLLSGEYEVSKDKAKFHFKTIELKDIRDAFSKVKTAKSFGIYNISCYFMKLALPYIETSLAFLFNPISHGGGGFWPPQPDFSTLRRNDTRYDVQTLVTFT